MPGDNGHIQQKTKAGNNGNNGNGHGTLDPAILDAITKQIAAQQKYKKIGGGTQDFKAETFLFHDALEGDEHSREVVSSDVPLRMVPLLTNWETLTEATSMTRVTRLSKIWISRYLLYRKPLDRQARVEAVSMGQQNQEQEAMKKALNE